MFDTSAHSLLWGNKMLPWCNQDQEVDVRKTCMWKKKWLRETGCGVMNECGIDVIDCEAALSSSLFCCSWNSVDTSLWGTSQEITCIANPPHHPKKHVITQMNQSERRLIWSICKHTQSRVGQTDSSSSSHCKLLHVADGERCVMCDFLSALSPRTSPPLTPLGDQD